MMVVATDEKDGFLLHPCVEINLRRTMGHVALSIPPFRELRPAAPAAGWICPCDADRTDRQVSDKGS